MPAPGWGARGLGICPWESSRDSARKGVLARHRSENVRNGGKFRIFDRDSILPVGPAPPFSKRGGSLAPVPRAASGRKAVSFREERLLRAMTPLVWGVSKAPRNGNSARHMSVFNPTLDNRGLSTASDRLASWSEVDRPDATVAKTDRMGEDR